MKEEYNKLINDSNMYRSNIYYQLNQLTAITGLSPRMLKYKMLKVKEKYAGVTKLLKKEGKRWFIHPSLIVEFLPVNKRKTNIDNYSNWSSFVTWNPFKNYDADYHVELIKEIKSELPNSIIKYTIELDKRGFNHVHFISDASTIKTKEIVEKVILKYFDWFEVSYQVTEINNKFTSNEYLQKSPVRNGILN